MKHLKRIIGLLSVVFFIVITTFLYVNAINLPQLDEKLISVSANPTYPGSYILFSPDSKVCITNVTVFGGGLGETQMRELYFNSSVEIKIGSDVYYRSKSNFTFGQYKTDNDGFYNSYKLTYDFETCVPLNVSTTYSLEMINAVALNGFRRGENAPVSNNWNITSSSNTNIYVWFFGNYWENYTCSPLWNCTSYSDCSLNNQYCNSVIDLNDCYEEYTGDYSEFTLSGCCISDFVCNGYGVCSNESLNPSCNMHIDNNYCGLQNCISAYDTKGCGIDYLTNCSYNDNEIVLTQDATIPIAFCYSWFESVPYNNMFCGQFFKVNESKILKGFTFITGIVNTGGNVTFHLKEGYSLDYSKDLTKGNIFVYPEWAYYNAEFDIPYLLKPNTSYYIFFDVNEENDTIMDISAYAIDYNTNPDLYIMCNVTAENTIYNYSNLVYTMNLTFNNNIFCGGNYSEFSSKKCNLPPIIDIIYSDLYNTMATNKSIDTIGFIFLIILFVILGILINYGFWFIVSVIFLVMAILSYIDTGDYRTNIIKTILYFILALCFGFLGLVMLILSGNKGKEKGFYDEFYD
jgi:hypothetical protein